MSDQYTPTGGQTIFPRINFLKTFSSRFDQRSANGRIFLSGGSTPTSAFELDFANSLSLVDSVSGNNLVTFSRASSGTYVGSDGLIKTAVADEPRFDHDPVTGKSLGLLIERSSTNKIRDSEDFDLITTGWTTTSSGATSLSGVLSPDGVTFMTLMDLSAVAGSVSSGSRVYQNNSDFKAVDQVFSFYARSVSGTGTFPVGYYNGSGYIKTYVELTETIKRYTMIVPASVSTGDIVGWTRRGDTQLETLDQALVWGAQFEDSAYPTSYIPTAAGSVTRSPDLCTIEGANFSSWYNQGEGTVFVEANGYPHPVSGKTLVALAFSDNTYDNQISLASSTGSAQFNFDVTVGGSQQRAILGNFVSSGLKSSGGYKSTGSAGSLDGAAVVTANTPNIPSGISQLSIGQTHAGSRFLDGHISRIAYYSQLLTDQQQIDLTT